MQCANCDAIVAGRVIPNESNTAIGREMACGCDDPEFEILDKEDPANG